MSPINAAGLEDLVSVWVRDLVVRHGRLSSPQKRGFSVSLPQIQRNRQYCPILTIPTSALLRVEVKWQLQLEPDFRGVALGAGYNDRWSSHGALAMLAGGTLAWENSATPF